MASLNAKAVAKEVLEKVRKGEKVSISGIMRKHGYSRRSAHALKVKETKTFQREIKSVVGAMEQLRKKTIKALGKKNLSMTEVRDLSTLLKNLNHDIQLIAGKPTEILAQAQIIAFVDSIKRLANE